MNSQPRIPFVNLDRQYDRLRPQMNEAIQAVLDSKAFIQGPFVESFERAFAEYLNVKYAVGCSNGTSAISLALEALGIGQGDEVITVSHTFAATASAIIKIGATPVFVDIDKDSYTIDPRAAEEAITPRTKALLPVHLYGTPCAMAPLAQLAKSRGLLLVEDAAQAHGAKLGDNCAGAIGDAATFSFYPGKNLGAYGDAGAIVTNNEALAAQLRKLRDHGRRSKYVHDTVGYNQRMDAIQAAVLSVKLQHLEDWNIRRRELASRYDMVLRQKGFKTISCPDDVTPVYHLYVAEVSNRDSVAKRMEGEGIATGVHYPVPLHQQPAFASWKGAREFPVTDRIVSRIISLPICGELTNAEQDLVIDAFVSVAEP